MYSHQIKRITIKVISAHYNLVLTVKLSIAKPNLYMWYYLMENRDSITSIYTISYANTSEITWILVCRWILLLLYLFLTPTVIWVRHSYVCSLYPSYLSLSIIISPFTPHSHISSLIMVIHFFSDLTYSPTYPTLEKYTKVERIVLKRY